LKAKLKRNEKNYFSFGVQEMDHLVLHPPDDVVSIDPSEVSVALPRLRSDERIGEILNDSKDVKVEEAALRNYKPEDFLMLLPQESSGEYMSPPNPFQSACAMCTTCKRVLVFPANAEDTIQCPACKKLVDVDTLAESKLLRSCPQCDTLLGNPTNAPKVLCPLCMKLIEWNSATRDPSIPPIEDTPKKKRQRKSQPSTPISGNNPDGSPGEGSKKKKGYIKKGEPGYIRPKYGYVKKGQPGYVRPKYNYVKKGQPGYIKPKSSYKRKKGHSEDESFIKEDVAAALLTQPIDATVVETVSEGIVREVTEMVKQQ